MRLEAGCDMQLSVDEPCTMVAMLRPRSGHGQWIHSEVYTIEPRVEAAEYVDVAGNLCQRLNVPAGTLRLRVECVVDTPDDIAVAPEAPITHVSELPDDALMYLLPSRYCPSDKLSEKAEEIRGSASGGYAQVEAVRSWIHENIEYRYGVSDGSTDALDTLNAGAGVCRDFSHIGISVCRALKIPARMVVGYLYGLDPMDMHAWFEAYLGGRWYTFDATQEKPRGGRIIVAYGRDAADVALITEYGPLTTNSMNVWVNRVDP